VTEVYTKNVFFLKITDVEYEAEVKNMNAFADLSLIAADGYKTETA